ncbi:Cytochrome P450 [Neofusicoccum parvum]|uniref:Cytochrome P450 n=1 Tax=Neofusicoccum parvum TaxID=310453 RepID=A0ACB5SDB0_9PEZI|nr:Cytochrome P450 [Neofusicoccum parvum]
MSITINFALLFCFALWVLQVVIQGLTGPLRKIPGPWYARFTNLPLKWATIKGRRIYFIEALHRRYGDIVIIAPSEVDCSDPQMFKEIHRHGNGFHKAQWYKKFSGYTDVDKNHSIFTMADPKNHAARRKLLARAFTKTEIRKHWEKEIRQKVSLAVERMNDDATTHPDGEVNVQKWWILMAADVSSRITFGESFNMLETGEKNDYIKAVESIARAGGIIAEIPIFKLLRYLPIPQVRNLLKTQATVIEFATTTVANSRKKGTTGAGNIFTGVLAEAEKSGSHLSDVVLGRDARALIVAGSDTTAITLTFLVWCVLSRPQLHRDLLAELHAARKQGSSADHKEFDFSDEQLERLPLLTAVIQESLRLYGAAPGSLPRQVPPGGTTVGGFYIPDSAVVSTQAWSLHRNPSVWNNPEEFDANRWLPGAEMSVAAKMAFKPFGGGSRVCLGLHIAEMELRYASAMFFWRYSKARLAPGTTEASMVPVYFFIINPKMHQCRVVLE